MDKKEKHRLYMRRYRATHPRNVEYQREYHRRYYADQRKKQVAKDRARAWYWANRDKALAAASQWQKLHRTKGRRRGERHHAWKGAAASYGAIHIWITGLKGRPSRCEACGTTTAKRFEWCNVDHQYRREPADYLRMCTACHRRYDYAHGLSAIGGPRSVQKSSLNSP